MKVVLNRVTSYEGRPLKIGELADIPLNIAQRWINKGIAHVPERISEIKPVEVKESEVIEKTEESIIFREPEEVEEAKEFEKSEPVYYLSEDEPTEVKEEEIKPKRKTKKKKIDEDNS